MYAFPSRDVPGSPSTTQTCGLQHPQAENPFKARLTLNRGWGDLACWCLLISSALTLKNQPRADSCRREPLASAGQDAQANPWPARRCCPRFLLLALLIVRLSFLISRRHPSLGQRSALHIPLCKSFLLIRTRAGTCQAAAAALVHRASRP